MRRSRYMALGAFVTTALFNCLSTAPAWADKKACDRIDAANHIRSVQANSTSTGFSFDNYTPDIYSGTRTCSHLRDETVAGELASVYAEHYQSSVGTTDAQLWISNRSGHLLREELDGNVIGKGKGHDSVRFNYSSK
jgi:hypothetical protein